MKTKTISKPAKLKAKPEEPTAESVEKAVEEPVEAVTVKVIPELGKKYRFSNAENSFVASATSFEPLKVFVHSVRNGCMVEDELSIDSLFEYEINDLDAEDFAALNASDV